MNTTAATTNAMTEPQRAYLNKLATLRDLGPMREKFMVKVNDPATTRKEASALIDMAKTLPWLPKDQDALPGTGSPERESFTLEDGMYVLDRMIFKVQHAIHGSGKQYAKRLELIEPDCGGCTNGDPCDDPCEWEVTFVYAPGAINKLRPEMRMTREEAREFGALYGTCANCGRTLTDEKSIEQGYGPVCAKRFA